MKTHQDTDSDVPEVASLCHTFQSRRSPNKVEDVTGVIDVETYIAFCLLFLAQYVYDFSSTAARWGAGPHNLLLLVAPVVIVVWGAVVLCWRWAFQRIPQFMSISVLVGFATQMASLHWQVPLQVRDFLETVHGPEGWNEAMLHGAARLASSQLLVPRLLFAGLLCQLSAAFPHNKISLFVHVSLPVAMGLTTLLSPNVYFDLCELIGFASLICFILLLRVRKTLSGRKRVMADEAAAEVCEGCRVADSLLCHKVKNAVVDASHLIESFLQQPLNHSLPMLSQAQGRLQIAMRWFGRRRMILKLRGAEYCPQVEAASLAASASTVLSGWTVVRKTIHDAWLMLDWALFEFLLDCVVSNATKHGCPGASDIAVEIDLQSAHPDGPRQRLVVNVTNRANPVKPGISEGLVSEALEARRPDMSGLQCAFAAANALGMTTSLTQEDETVSFTGVMDAQVARARPSHASDMSVPVGLNVCCIDDNAVARRFMSAQLLTRLPDCTSHVFGETRGDVAAFRQAALEEADIAVLDQNLEYEGETVLGTTIMGELLAAGFQGLLCIRSANTSPPDVDLYERSGAHCVIDKTVPARKMIQQIVTKYKDFRSSQLSSQGSSRMSLRPGTSRSISSSASADKVSDLRLLGSRSFPYLSVSQSLPSVLPPVSEPMLYTQIRSPSVIAPSSSLPSFPQRTGSRACGTAHSQTRPHASTPPHASPAVPHPQPPGPKECAPCVPAPSPDASRRPRIMMSPASASLLHPAATPSRSCDRLALVNTLSPCLQPLLFGVVPRPSTDWQDATSSASAAAAPRK